jgi:hypothetical protein
LVGKDVIGAKKDRLGHNAGDYQIITIFRNVGTGIFEEGVRY